jgi:hypothetical protein
MENQETVSLSAHEASAFNDYYSEGATGLQKFGAAFRMIPSVVVGAFTGRNADLIRAQEYKAIDGAREFVKGDNQLEYHENSDLEMRRMQTWHSIVVFSGLMTTAVGGIIVAREMIVHNTHDSLKFGLVIVTAAIIQLADGIRTPIRLQKIRGLTRKQ